MKQCQSFKESVAFNLAPKQQLKKSLNENVMIFARSSIEKNK